MNCPRCSVALDNSEFDGVPMQMCGGCMGALVRQRDLVPLLEKMSAELAREMSFDHTIEPVTDHAGKADCPQCGKHMDCFGYMESNLVYADRCSTCWVIWTDPDEIGVMAVLYARTHHRTGARQADRDEWQDAMSSRVSSLLRSRAGGGGAIRF